MKLSGLEFLAGVLVAVASFLIKEMITGIVSGIRYRKRLAIDIKMTVEAFKQHYPELEKIKTNLSAPEAKASYIWDSQSDSWGDLQKNTQHLRPDEATQCANFYDVLGRIEEIRKEYNLSVRGMISDQEKKERLKDSAEACLSDLQKNYRQAIRTGCECMIELKCHHWFLDVDLSQCKDTLGRMAERTD